MGLYSKYTRIAGAFSNEELHKKFEELTSNGFEIVHYEEKKQEPDRFYVTMILGTLSEATEVVKFLKG